MENRIKNLIAEHKSMIEDYDILIKAANERKSKFRNALTTEEAHSFSDACIDLKIASAQRQRTVQFVSDLECLLD